MLIFMEISDYFIASISALLKHHNSSTCTPLTPEIKQLEENVQVKKNKQRTEFFYKFSEYTWITFN